jgi:hypothetical protein
MAFPAAAGEGVERCKGRAENGCDESHSPILENPHWFVRASGSRSGASNDCCHRFPGLISPPQVFVPAIRGWPSDRVSAPTGSEGALNVGFRPRTVIAADR